MAKMSGPSRKRPAADEWTADTWYREFFSQCCLPEQDAEDYAVVFTQNGMQSDMLPLLTKELLQDMKINKVGHIIAIMRTAQEFSSQEQRSEIIKPNVQSKVINLKSIAKLKDRKTRRESEIGGGKSEPTAVKRSLPDEGPTLSIKMPKKARPTPPVVYSEVTANITSRPPVKDSDFVEVSSTTEKKQKRSVFDRLGGIISGQVAPASSSVNSSPGGILKKNHPSGSFKGPLKFCSSSSGPASSPASPPRQPQIANSPPMHGKSTARSLAEPLVMSQSTHRSTSPPVSKPTIEPSFHVTVNMMNPLVTKVSNGPHNKRQQDRRNTVISVHNKPTSTSVNRSNSGASMMQNERSYLGSMAADKIERSKGLGVERDMKQRLGNRANSSVKSGMGEEKKRVSFGSVRTKEIPAVPGTGPVLQTPSSGNPILARRFYTGSVAFGTAKRVISK